MLLDQPAFWSQLSSSANGPTPHRLSHAYPLAKKAPACAREHCLLDSPFPCQVRQKQVFDDLLLVTLTPRGVYIHKHDLETAVCQQVQCAPCYLWVPLLVPLPIS